MTAGKVIEEWNPRFVAFAASLGRSPEAQRAYSLRDVRRQGPFIVWIQQQWFAFFRELGLPERWESSQLRDGEFDRWLAGRFPPAEVRP